MFDLMYRRKHPKPLWAKTRFERIKGGGTDKKTLLDANTISTLIALLSVIVSGLSAYIAWISAQEIAKDRAAVFQSV
jgi:hypothetical protein